MSFIWMSRDSTPSRWINNNTLKNLQRSFVNDLGSNRWFGVITIWAPVHSLGIFTTCQVYDELAVRLSHKTVVGSEEICRFRDSLRPWGNSSIFSIREPNL